MKPHILIQSLMMLLVSLLISCDQKKEKTQAPAQPVQKQNAPQDSQLNQALTAIRMKQAGGLGNGTVEVNSAWTYTGYSFLDAVSGARLVAVDVTITGHTSDFDFDDIEIIDGASRISYGSDPHITLLSPDGKARPDAHQWPPPPDPVRVMLIYGFPKETKSFTLYYWGKNLLRENHSVESSGWELPFPKTEAN